MNGLRKPRQMRWLPQDPISLAKKRAARLTTAEVRDIMDPIKGAHRALREGVATEWQWTLLASAMNVAQAIERQGVVRGLKEHLHSAEMALAGIRQRAVATGDWQAPTLYFQELDNVTAAVNFHEYQLLQLSDGELRQCSAVAIAEIRSTGGRVFELNPAGQVPVQQNLLEST